MEYWSTSFVPVDLSVFFPLETIPAIAAAAAAAVTTGVAPVRSGTRKANREFLRAMVTSHVPMSMEFLLNTTSVAIVTALLARNLRSSSISNITIECYPNVPFDYAMRSTPVNRSPHQSLLLTKLSKWSTFRFALLLLNFFSFGFRTKIISLIVLWPIQTTFSERLVPDKLYGMFLVQESTWLSRHYERILACIIEWLLMRRKHCFTQSKTKRFPKTGFFSNPTTSLGVLFRKLSVFSFSPLLSFVSLVLLNKSFLRTKWRVRPSLLDHAIGRWAPYHRFMNHQKKQPSSSYVILSRWWRLQSSVILLRFLRRRRHSTLHHLNDAHSFLFHPLLFTN